jgi:hypothetical protein
MYEVIGHMAVLIACGVLWRMMSPMGLDADTVRQAITGLVYALLLPALVLLVLWRAPLGVDVLRVALSAAIGVVIAMLLAGICYRFLGVPRRVAGALVLAAAFPNATYMGLPVLESIFGPWGSTLAIQYDLFACTPLLLTLGILLAKRYGDNHDSENAFLGLLKVPPFWAAIIAVALNLLEVPQPSWSADLLQMMGGAVVPLMLIALGLGLRVHSIQLSSLPVLIPAVLIQLLVMPLLVYGAALWLGLSGKTLVAVALEAAMPSMIIGLVLCDRYGLDTARYAITVTLTTAVSLLTLPLWFDWLT